jgi:hypothetical protein
MKKKTFALITITSLGSIVFIIALYFITTSYNHRKNGFIRLFPPHIADPMKDLDIKFNSYYIAGASSNTIYLGNHTAPKFLLLTDLNLLDTHQIQLNIPNNNDIKQSVLKVTIDSPHIYMISGLTSTFLYGEVSNYEIDRKSVV